MAAHTPGKGDGTRERILERAMRDASLVGLERLSIGHLARAEDMSKSGVFAHFGSKEDLQLAVLETTRQSFIEHVTRPAFAEARGEPRLRSIFEHWLDWEEGQVTPGGCPFLVAALEFDNRPGAVRDRVAGAHEELLGMLGKAVGHAVGEGHLATGLDIEQVVFELYGIILNFHIRHHLLRQADSRARARRAFESLLTHSR